MIKSEKMINWKQAASGFIQATKMEDYFRARYSLIKRPSLQMALYEIFTVKKAYL
ncbi:hypothetical protein GCM10007107_17060 [Shewanella indica]|nr:hypothetical protein GCM10007107_17060 [Shewanella indica]